MTDKPEIKVGQRWVTAAGRIVHILADSARGMAPLIGQFEDDNDAIGKWCRDGFSPMGGLSQQLVQRAPSTVKREVALYRGILSGQPVVGECLLAGAAQAISEPLTIEFTLLPGESADA